MTGRLRLWLHAWLIAVDQLAHVSICFPTFVLLGRGACPNQDETISSRVGRNAIAGKAWARVLERVINLPFRLAGERDHCRNSVETFGGCP